MKPFTSSLPPIPKYLGILPRKTLRLKEKYMILLVFATFGIVCLGAIFFLPDQVKMTAVKRRLHEAGNDMFVPQMKIGSDGIPILHGKVIHHDPNELDDFHAEADKRKLHNKIRKDWESEKAMEHIAKRLNMTKDDHIKVRDDIKQDKHIKKQEDILRKVTPVANGPGVEKANPIIPPKLPGSDNTTPDTNLKVGPAPGVIPKANQEMERVGPLTEHNGGRNVGGSEPKNEQAKFRRDTVKEMMKFAWDNYVKYAWGANELKPKSKTAHSSGIFGRSSLGASIIDSLSTLYIMGLMKDFQLARDWVAKHFNFDNGGELSVFETNIRFVGGLLSAYALSGDPLFKEKADSVAKRLLPAFNTPTGIPHAMVNIRSGASRNWGWASGGCSILSEFGTLHLEFTYLSAITGNPVYAQKVNHIRKFVKNAEKPNGLYPNYLHPNTGNWGSKHISIGALGDSFYEYLLKGWIQSGKTDTEARLMYDGAIEAMERHMLRTSKGGLLYYADSRSGNLDHKMGHLACFSGGMLALGAAGSKNKTKYLQQGAGIANTCHESYIRSVTKLGPESFRFEGPREAMAMRQNEKYFILRPETFETYFYMWRLTHDQKYRDWGWQAIEAMNKHCRVIAGFSGIRDVYADPPTHDDVQQSWLFAESFKYLYLLFSEDDTLPLNNWVLNTEAHPLPIWGSPTWKIVNVKPANAKTSKSDTLPQQ